MGIATSIVALSPAMYWALDSGNANDLSGHGNSGVAAGDFSWTGSPVEPDLKSLHLNPGGSVLGGALGLSGNHDLSFFTYVAVQPQPGTTTPAIFAGAGNPGTGATQWGFGLRQAWVSAQVSFSSIWAPSPIASFASITQAPGFWYSVGLTYVAATRVLTTWVNGVASTAATGTGTLTGLHTTDAVLLQSSIQMNLTHVAVWDRVLTSTEIGTFATATTQWPFQMPGYAQVVTTTTGGGLTAEQAAQLAAIDTRTTDMQTDTVQIPYIVSTTNTIEGTTDTINGKTTTIQTDTQNIVNTLLPQLADVVNDIGASIVDVANRVTGSIIEGGTEIAKTVGELLSPREHTELEEINYSGGPTCSPIFKDLTGQRVYGITVHITAYPADWEFRTPDNGWSLKDLAVLRLYHNGDLVLRHGIHTITHVVEPIPQRGLPWIWGVVPLQNPGTVVTVDFAPGVCGELIGNEGST